MILSLTHPGDYDLVFDCGMLKRAPRGSQTHRVTWIKFRSVRSAPWHNVVDDEGMLIATCWALPRANI